MSTLKATLKQRAPTDDDIMSSSWLFTLRYAFPVLSIIPLNRVDGGTYDGEFVDIRIVGEPSMWNAWFTSKSHIHIKVHWIVYREPFQVKMANLLTWRTQASTLQVGNVLVSHRPVRG